MAKEIEHKYLVCNEEFKQHNTVGVYYRQGYIPTQNGMTVRVRIAGEKGFLTLKDKAKGLARNEFEYAIPLDDAQQMLEQMCDPAQIEKERYVIPSADGIMPDGTAVTGLKWEVDVFHGLNEGIVVAEIEVPDERVSYPLPHWIGKEVTDDPQYRNTAMCRRRPV